mmetsp:Transcript_24391/g.75200  ORF Transcript_24391/g.75200 Transcript_24391/m.75200 type:complete len:203 (-) Transcript_24391:960-1568(-)
MLGCVLVTTRRRASPRRVLVHADGLADAVDGEADFAQRVRVDDVPAVEDEGRFGHGVVDLLVVQRLELVPLRRDGDGVRSRRRRVRVGRRDDEVVQPRLRLLGQVQRVLELHHHRLARDLGVVDVHARLLLDQVARDERGGRLARVAGVLLEREAEDGNLLAGDGVEHGLDDVEREARLLVVVHLADPVPVLRALAEAVRLA